jgi:hypothetical protein
MKAQNAHEDILVISAPSHCFDEVNVCMFCTLSIGVIRVAPHDGLTDLVQDAMGFVEIPTSLLATFVREITLQQLQEIHSILMKGNKAFSCDVAKTTVHIPLHAQDEHLNHIITRVRDMC